MPQNKSLISFKKINWRKNSLIILLFLIFSLVSGLLGFIIAKSQSSIFLDDFQPEYYFNKEYQETVESLKKDYPSGAVTLTSPLKGQTATFYASPEPVYPGDPIFTHVDMKKNNQITSYPLSGDFGPVGEILIWSKIDNRVYFTHSTNGILNYSLWSANPDVTDAKLVAGNTDNPPYKSQSELLKTTIYGAKLIKFSSDHQLVATVRQDYLVDGKSPLWVMNYDGSNSKSIDIPKEIYANQEINSLSWDPKQPIIYFSVNKEGREITYQTDLEGQTTQLPGN